MNTEAQAPPETLARPERHEAGRQDVEEAYRILVESSQQGLLLIQQGRVVFANRMAAQLTGYTVPELLANSLEQIITSIHPEDRAMVRQRHEDRLRGLPSPPRYEFRVIRQDGGLRWLELQADAVEYQGRRAVQIGLLDVTERKRAEETLQARERQLRFLASELALAEERERRRIAGELHDHACQSLVLARMKLDEALASMSGTQAKVFRGISRTLNEAIEGVRELTFDLSSPTLYRFGLEAALEELLGDRLRAQKGLEYAFSDDCRPKPLTDDVRVMLFQSVREILVNMLKHARAHKIDLDVSRTGDSIRIAVTDDGVGFNVAAVFSLPSRQRGFGLFNLKERLDYVGGTLEIESQPGKGSRFILVAPLKLEGDDSGRSDGVDQDSVGG